MKKIIILLIQCFICTFTIMAQNYRKPNTVYLVFQPVNHGIGLRYDRMIKSSNYGIYGSLMHKDMKLVNGLIIKHHYKLVSGVLLYGDPMFNIFHPYVGVGVSYNAYDGLYNIPPAIPENELSHWSFDVSLNTRIYNIINAGIIMDPMLETISFNVGFTF